MQPGAGLLARLGLSEGAVRNVLITRDIVPRAFACDYTLVADILKRVSPAFRQHRCLSGGRRVVRFLPSCWTLPHFALACYVWPANCMALV